MGSVPRTKYSLEIIDRSVVDPSGSVTCAESQPEAGRLPDSRQTLTETMLRGVGIHSALALAVADFMKPAHSGTATSAA